MKERLRRSHISKGMDLLTGSGFVQNENVGKSDELQTNADSSHLSSTYTALSGISYPCVSQASDS